MQTWQEVLVGVLIGVGIAMMIAIGKGLSVLVERAFRAAVHDHDDIVVDRLSKELSTLLTPVRSRLDSIDAYIENMTDVQQSRYSEMRTHFHAIKDHLARQDQRIDGIVHDVATLKANKKQTD